MQVHEKKFNSPILALAFKKRKKEKKNRQVLLLAIMSQFSNIRLLANFLLEARRVKKKNKEHLEEINI